MIKKTLISALFFLCFAGVTHAATVTHPYYGTTSESNGYLWADRGSGDDDFTSFQYVSHSSNAEIRYYTNVDGKATYTSSDSLSNGSGSVSPPSGTNAIKLFSHDGGEVYLTYATSTNPVSTNINFEAPENSGGGDNGGGSDGGSDCGCIFNTPGWGDYMDKIDEIKNAIPPAPNWDNVADTFRDSIVPSLISGVDNMLGSAPGKMSPPSHPPPLDEGNLQEPTGQEANGLDGFDSNDIKDNADNIEFREDDSGGFDIDNPLESMPEQETFIPEEPDNPAPEEPEEPENIAPVPEEQENTAPTPEEPEIETPTPTEPENTAPKPEEPELEAPAPEEQENTAPIPGDGGNTAPIPGDGGNTAPIPGDTDESFPVPGEQKEGFPMPN